MLPLRFRTYLLLCLLLTLTLCPCCNKPWWEHPEDYEGYEAPISLSPNAVTLSSESQNFHLTSNNIYHILKITVEGKEYNDFPSNSSNSVQTGSVDVEWIHWAHVEGNDFSTMSVDENLTGKVRTASMKVKGLYVSDCISITQLP